MLELDQSQRKKTNVKEMRCIVCGNVQTERHHFRTRGAGGSDENFNILLLCREHHQEIHKIGSITFAKKYKAVETWLLKNGWIYETSRCKWTRY